ncbi:MAG: NAD(P)H-hydrate dehydratase [Pseudomonadota bacterium]
MRDLPPMLDYLYTGDQTRSLDRCAIEEFGIAGSTLMGRAANAAFNRLIKFWPNVERLQVLCGTGNNGGDGFLIADLAHKRKLPVKVLQLGDEGKIRGDALQARQQALANGVAFETYRDGLLDSGAVVIDAMLGTGLGGDVREPYRTAIEAVNVSGAPVLAVDIPSGVCADSGRVLGAAVRADLTVTFIGLKRGLFTYQGQGFAGDVEFSDLEVPAEVYQRVPADSVRLELPALLGTLPPRSVTAHKGDCGTVLVVGGDYGMAGAASLAAEAALRCGAGLVSVATRLEHVAPLVARVPEVMAHGVAEQTQLEPLVDAADVLVLGPGLGQSAWSLALAQTVLAGGKPLVMDADALNLLAAGSLDDAISGQDWILSPHPGEAGRLLRTDTAAVQGDRFAAVRELQQRYGGVVVLKGNGTLVCDRTGIGVANYGNPGMATGGMGDVLSGVLGALAAQGLSLAQAGALGVCLHGAAADAAAIEGERGLVATDLMPQLRSLIG